MEDKRLKDTFSHASEQELQFSKEDREKVFIQIRQQIEGTHRNKKNFIFINKLVPVGVSFLAVALCLFLFMPSFLPGNGATDLNSMNMNKESNVSSANSLAVEEAKFFTTLITVKSKEMDNRIYLNLLLTYNKHKKIVNVVSFPTNTYVPIAKNNDGSTLNDKLLFAYQFGGAENVKTAVSNLIDLPIDFYAVIDLETISTLIDSINGIEYELQEDVQIRAITQVAFEFEKGRHHFNGEEIVSLLMAATDGHRLDEENLVNLMHAVVNKTEDEVSQQQLKQLFSQIETNGSLESLLENLSNFNGIKQISLLDGMISDTISISNTEAKQIYKFEQDFLNSVTEELTTFNDSIKSFKEEYLKKINDTKIEAEKLEATDSSTYALKKVEHERWELWDKLLNELYSVLEEQLLQEEMDQLRAEQRNWLKYRDDSALEASQKYKGGTQEQLEYLAVLATLTEQRCYELVGNYIN